MPNKGGQDSTGSAACLNRRYGHHSGSSTNMQAWRHHSQVRQDCGSGHCRGHRWEYEMTGLPRWARTRPRSRRTSCVCEGTVELADLEREADALEAEAAAIRERLESVRREQSTHKTTSDDATEEK